MNCHSATLDRPFALGDLNRPFVCPGSSPTGEDVPLGDANPSPVEGLSRVWVLERGGVDSAGEGGEDGGLGGGGYEAEGEVEV